MLPLIGGVCLAFYLFFALSLSQIVSTSPTFDEGFSLLRGYAALRTSHLVPIGHPPLAHWLTATGVLLEPNLPDPRELDGWYSNSYDDSSRDLLWQRGLNANRITFLGRFPILLLGLILGAVTARWAKDLFGWGVAALALALHALSPNLLAHSALATTDLPVAAFYVFTLYAWHRYTRAPNRRNIILTGLMLGCALAAKFSALLLLPTLGLLALVHLIRNRANLQQLVGHGLLTLLIALLTVWANYGFVFSPYPLAQYMRELTDLGTLASEGHTAYLFGALSAKGWWYYHPITFLVKTPIPVLLLILAGAGIVVYRWLRKRLDNSYWLSVNNVMLPAAVYFLAATLSSLNVGYRYLLPALPLLHIVAASVVAGQPFKSTRVTVATSLALAWQVISTLLITPNFLAYFNELVGPANGYKVLADSNLDWGQDLPALARYLNGRPVYLSYFGMADPAYYGIQYEPLPGWPPPDETRFAPADPAPGLYAISASDLVGVQLFEPNTFAYFRNLAPQALINYSIFVYEVPNHEPVAAFAQCTPPLLNDEAVAFLLDDRPVRQIAYDCQNSLIIPGQPSVLLYLDTQDPIWPLPAPTFTWTHADGTAYYNLYPSQATVSSAPPLSPSKYLSLLNYDLNAEALTLMWLVNEPAPPPVSVFVHFNWPDGALAEAYDGLGVPAEYWQEGDVIIQRHPISPDLPPGEYGVVVGLYSLANGTRYSEIPLTTYQK